MTLSTSKLAYDDCYAVMDAALADDQGARMRMADLDAATHFRMRCHQARKIDRELNAETYEKGHALHNVSEYDRLTFKIRGGATSEVWLLVERTKIIPGEVLSLATGEQLELELPQRALPSAPEPQRRIAPPTDTEMGEAFEGIDTVAEAPLDSEVLPKQNIRRV